MKRAIKRILYFFKSVYFGFKSFKKPTLPENPDAILNSIRPFKDFSYSFQYHNGNKNILLSIGITTYNCSKWIENTINTIKQQPYQEKVEIVFVDNASTDNTVELIKKCTLGLQFPFKIIVNEQNGMAGYSRTKVVEHSDGKFVLFLDGDDGLMQGSLSRIMSIITEFQDLDLIQLGPISFKPKDRVIDNSRIYEIGGMPGAKIINRNTWGNLTFPINCNFEDTVFAFEYFDRVKKAYVSSTNDYWIRPVNPESLSRKKSSSFLDHINVVTFLYKRLEHKDVFSYQLLLKHFSLLAYFRIRHFDIKTQLAAYSKMRSFIIQNRIGDLKLNLKFRKIEKAILSGNYYRWVSCSFRYF